MTHMKMIIVTGETIKKKYNSILDMLKRERLTFSNQLESLESQIRKQVSNSCANCPFFSIFLSVRNLKSKYM